MKKQIGHLQATPSKRLFMSIIADYDLSRAICELVDNGLDVWVRGGRKSAIAIDIDVDVDQKTIVVKDTAGGLPKAELGFIVGPGQTGSNATDETIGIFGVGTKRAVVALAQDITISTRFGTETTYQIEFDDHWIEEEDWELPFYEVDPIQPGSTIVSLQRLRVPVGTTILDNLRDHLSATYSKFLGKSGITIRLNGKSLKPVSFEGWAYPPGYEPRHYEGTLVTAEGREVRVDAVAGLGDESSPATGEYGVYVYCNDRLIARALKTFEVGFAKGMAGIPHPKISLTRMVISLHGDAASMPWNSSKSDINTKHAVFQALQQWIISSVKDFAQLSRIWMGDWPDKVFKYRTGKMVEIAVNDFPAVRKSYLPPMPKSRPRFGDVVAEINRSVAKRKPWVKGLYEGVVAADLIGKQHLEQKNRIALIVLDSTLEIAFKEYLVNESGKYFSDKQLHEIFKSRHEVHLEIKKHVALDDDTWKLIAHFSDVRNKLIHQRASATISDSDLASFREVVEQVLKALYKVSFG